MLHKVAIHQTRLKVPGVGLDARGVCLGAKGLVLLPSLDRLVALLAICTHELGLSDLLESVRIRVVRSALGAREVALSFDVVTSELLDQVASIGRLAGGFTFTGTNRHFVQFRDDSAPFGYDAPELLGGEGDLCLYHSTFSQRYATERELELRRLVLRLGVRPQSHEASSGRTAWVLTAPALGAPLARHLVHAGIEAKLGSVKLASASTGTHGSEHWLFRLPTIAPRIAGLLRHTPGLSLFFEQCAGAAVQAGFTHPLALAACPVFRAQELVLFGAGKPPPYVIEKLPLMVDVATLVQPKSLELKSAPVVLAADSGEAMSARAQVQLLPTAFATRAACAARLLASEASQLRRVAYLLSPEALTQTRLAVTDQGLFLIQPPGGQSLPLGALYGEFGQGLYGPLGYELVPRVDAGLVRRTMGVSEEHKVFMHRDGSCHAIPDRAFATLAEALLEPQLWSEVHHQRFPEPLSTKVPTLWLDPLGILPLKRAKPAP